MPTERQDGLLAAEDPRFFAVDAVGTGLGMIATSERLPDGTVVDLGLPSGPSLFLDVAWSAHTRRRQVEVADMFDEHPNGRWPDEHGPLFDYLQDATTEIVMSYTAVEAAMNELIGPQATYRKPGRGNRPPTELRGVDIERKVSLEEKLRKALPAIVGIASPAGTRLWQDFAELEAIRDRPVHLKSVDRQARGPAVETAWGILLGLGAKVYPDVALRMIAHFHPPERRWLREFTKRFAAEGPS